MNWNRQVIRESLTPEFFLLNCDSVDQIRAKNEMEGGEARTFDHPAPNKFVRRIP